jgi:hypothetical protein
MDANSRCLYRKALGTRFEHDHFGNPTLPDNGVGVWECRLLIANLLKNNNKKHFRDEYMLNKCIDKVWFVIDLCESIKAFRIEIANFELYSSGPKEFNVWLGNVYPGRDKDWSLFGHFEAEDTRSIQTFVTNQEVFGKYVKVDIISHHGSEHYCPVSLFKIFGISEIELIGADDDEDQDDPADFNPTEAATKVSVIVIRRSPQLCTRSKIFKLDLNTFITAKRG